MESAASRVKPAFRRENLVGANMPRLEPTGVRVARVGRREAHALHRGLCAVLGALVCHGALGLEGTAPPGAAPPASTATAATSTPNSTALDGRGCRIVRLSDIGWTDVTATTALFGVLLRHLGYRPEITVLSLPVTYTSMKNRDIDVFLGNWMPTQETDRKSYVADRKSTRLNSSHRCISYAVFCLKKKKK